MKVKLIHDIEGVVKAYVGGKTCYSPDGPIEIYKNLQREINSMKSEKSARTRSKIENFLEMLIRMGHTSVVEHWSVTILIEDVSRSLTHQLVRSRIASYSQQSQRYVTIKEMFKFVTPPEIKKIPEADEEYQKGMKTAFEKYISVYGLLYDNYLCSGMKEKKADKLAAEDSRYLLPNAACTNIVTTVNIRELMHIMEQRLCKRAQWEIRGLFKEIRKEFIREFPFMKDYLGPKCMFRPCTEEDDCDMKEAFSKNRKVI